MILNKFLLAIAFFISVSTCSKKEVLVISQSPCTGSGMIALQLPDKNGNLQVFVENSDGTGQQQLTSKGINGRPTWSPDGKKIAYISFQKHPHEGGRPDTWIMNADGSDKKMIATGVGVDDWSPDGSKLIFSIAGEISIMDPDGSNQKQITKSGSFKAGPTWSYDGKQIAFILITNPAGLQSPTPDPRPEIGIMNADGTNERILTVEDRMNVHLEPNGTATLLETAYDANAPSWAPLDNRIAFWSGIEMKYGQIWFINADGTGSKQLTEEPNHRNNDDPSWSPDGKKILFSTGRSGKNELWVMDADGKNERKISDMGADPFPGRAQWQPVCK